MKLLNCISIFIYEVKVLKQFTIFYSECIIKNKFQPREKKLMIIQKLLHWSLKQLSGTFSY